MFLDVPILFWIIIPFIFMWGFNLQNKADKKKLQDLEESRKKIIENFEKKKDQRKKEHEKLLKKSSEFYTPIYDVIKKHKTEELKRNHPKKLQKILNNTFERHLNILTKLKNSSMQNNLVIPNKRMIGIYKDEWNAFKKISNGKLNYLPAIESEIKWHEKKISIKENILRFLKKEKTKLPASDIDFQLKIGNVDLVKALCEEMYRDKKIGRTGNYRYFV